ncbi:hypothetical protein Ade02nite_93740 [Paractinoplanes deccanensis]|uniref:Uncharacterized protein n=1 Tax=Paractinoplanes deccanensis TaxID=113561 RepID=A0ABQ3YL54_9ACTN|nr:hypothetical protein Ade02nite_93740 [Actinoplanes deccanensis]
MGSPMMPERTAASRAACDGISRYCSATCTSACAPGVASSASRPGMPGAGGVSARTGRPSATASAITPGFAARGTAVTRKSGRVSRTQEARSPKAGTGRSGSPGRRTTAPTQSTVGRACARRW